MCLHSFDLRPFQQCAATSMMRAHGAAISFQPHRPKDLPTAEAAITGTTLIVLDRRGIRSHGHGKKEQFGAVGGVATTPSGLRQTLNFPAACSPDTPMSSASVTSLAAGSAFHRTSPGDHR